MKFEKLNVQKWLNLFLLVIGVFYFIGFVLHFLDILNLRLRFSDMPFIWRIWIVYLFIFDFVAALGLFLKKFWGELTFLFVGLTQLVAYIFFSDTFSGQNLLIVFHIASITTYFVLKRLTAHEKKYKDERPVL